MPQIGRRADVERHGRRHAWQRALPAGQPAAGDASVPSASQPAQPRPCVLAITLPHRQAVSASMHVEVSRHIHDMPQCDLSGDACLLYR